MPIYASSQSIWEKESFYSRRDVIIVGAGLSGLWAAYHLKTLAPSLSITIVERGLIPSGASTRNAGFACFGSLTELLSDIATMGEDKMLELVSLRYRGLQQIIKTFEPAAIDFSLCGGYELLLNSDKATTEKQVGEIESLNNLLVPVLGAAAAFRLAPEKLETFGFSKVQHLVENKSEGYLHPGKLCEVLSQRVQGMGVTILNGINVNGYTKTGSDFLLLTEQPYTLKASNLLFCTNAFTGSLITGIDLKPARGQVLVTNEIPGLKFKGTFHADEGYYYFRNLGNRILIGGARNQDFTGETSTEMHTTASIQAALEAFISEYILPATQFSVSDRWSGIMAMGGEKLPIVRSIEPGIFCSVRMSGMGVALTPVTGEMIARQMLGKTGNPAVL